MSTLKLNLANIVLLPINNSKCVWRFLKTLNIIENDFKRFNLNKLFLEVAIQNNADKLIKLAARLDIVKLGIREINN